MEKLVELYQGKEARVSTFLIYKYFGYKEHRQFKKIIRLNINNFEKHGKVFTASVDAVNKIKGRPDESYLLNEEQFTLLVMLAKNTPESVDLKMRIVDEFFRMRKMLASLASQKQNSEYQNVRRDGKVVYLQKADAIKRFVDYATEQGSKSANMYYTNLAQMENKALFLMEQKFPNVREVLNIRQLMQVAAADQIVEKALEDGMDKKLDYHDIYTLAKERIIQFSNIIGKSLVIEMLENKLLNKA